MNKILELREKRAKAWEAAKAFLDSKRGNDGLLSAEDAATKPRTEEKAMPTLRFHAPVPEQRYDDPFRQAEYAYSLIMEAADE